VQGLLELYGKTFLATYLIAAHARINWTTARFNAFLRPFLAS
jgi:hypothetical protein